MADDGNNTRYPHDLYGVTRQKHIVGYPLNSYGGDDVNVDVSDDDEGIVHVDVEDDDDDDGGNGVQRIGKDDYEVVFEEDDDNNDEDYGASKHPKKRKLKSLMASYEFAPRVPASSSAPPPKQSYGGRNPLTDWTESQTFVLLNSWGDRFLKQGRKSLRSEEWQEVAEKVSQDSSLERTDTQCRNRLDTLKKKYKKEKVKSGGPSNWIYFKKMDELLSAPLPQQAGGLSCGVNSGEHVMNPEVHLNRPNGLAELMDSPGNSAGEENKSKNETKSVSPKRRKNGRGQCNAAAALKLLANSIQRFGDIYTKVEKSRREQMAELEKMRMDFHRDMEMQKREILEKARAEIEKIRRGDGEDNNASG